MHDQNASESVEHELTEAEREALREWYFGDQYDDHGLFAAVVRIKADAHAAGVAEGRAKVAALFSGGPDTPCRTTWREERWMDTTHGIECVEVPLDDLRAALAGTSPQGEGQREGHPHDCGCDFCCFGTTPPHDHREIV